jgi:hypothetical protein
MAWQCMMWAHRLRLDSPIEYRVLMVLCDHAHKDGTGAWPAVATIAAEAEMGERTVQRALAVLRQRGLIEVDTPATRYTSAVYRMNMAGDFRGDKNDVQGCQIVHLRVTQNAFMGDSVSPKPVLEPVLEPVHPTTRAREARGVVVSLPMKADDWGLRAWLDRQPQVADEPGLFSPRGWGYDALLDVMCATDLPKSWRGPLEPLGEWVREGYRPDSIALVIAEYVAASGIVARRLNAFNYQVRSRAFWWRAKPRGEWIRRGRSAP